MIAIISKLLHFFSHTRINAKVSVSWIIFFIASVLFQSFIFNQPHIAANTVWLLETQGYISILYMDYYFS